MRSFSANLVTGSALLFLAGWFRFCFTGQFIVDGNYPLLPTALAIGLLVIGSIVCLSRAGLRLHRYPVRDFSAWVRTRRWPLLISFTLLVFTPPLLSNDLFSYLYYGRFSLSGYDPYQEATFRHAASNVFYAYTSPLYQQTTCKYGPLALITTFLPAASGSVWAGLLAYKFINALFVLLLFFQTGKYPRLLPFFFTAVLLIEVTGQGHNDGLAIYFGLLLLQAARGGNGMMAALWGLCMLLSKFLYLPLIVVAGSMLLPSWKKSIGYAGMLAAGLLSWYFIHPLSLTTPVLSGMGLRPSGSWADVSLAALRVAAPQWADTAAIIRFFQGVGIGACLYILGAFIYRRQFHFSSLPRLLAYFVLVYFIVYLHRLFPWYMLFLLPLAILLPYMDMRWMTVSLGLFVAQGLVHQFIPGGMLATAYIGVITPLTQVSLTVFLLRSLQNNTPMESS